MVLPSSKQKEIAVFLVFYVCGCVGTTRLKSLSFVFFRFVCFLTTKAALCVSSSLSPSIPTPSQHLPRRHFLSHPARLVHVPASTVLSIFNYNHTVQGFQALSCRAGTILITKLKSKAAEMPAQADICFATRSSVRLKIKREAQFSHTSSFVFSETHIRNVMRLSPVCREFWRWRQK